jgi:hypothetical protein
MCCDFGNAKQVRLITLGSVFNEFLVLTLPMSLGG